MLTATIGEYTITRTDGFRFAEITRNGAVVASRAVEPSEDLAVELADWIAEFGEIDA